MKTKILLLLISLATLSTTATTNKTTINTNITITEKVIGVFDGSDEFGYTFILNIDGEGIIFKFNNLDKKVGKVYNLESNDFVGKSFKITFEMITNTSEEDEEEEDLYTITALEAL